MNIVQSFWSQPVHITGDGEFEKFCGGWLCEKHHAISWAFSLSLLRKYHNKNKISLFTDTAGAGWLVNQVGLEYDEVNTSLDQLNHYDHTLWAIGKLYTYSHQDNPFLHVDGDVFTWQSLFPFLKKGNLLVQSFEIGHEVYRTILKDAAAIGIKFPEIFSEITANLQHVAVNAGVMGGTDIEFFKNYCRFAFDFIDQNHDKIATSEKKGGYNIIFEQLFIALLAIRRYGSLEAIDTLVTPEVGQVAGLTAFGQVPAEVKYIHILGMTKTMPAISNHMEFRFAYEFPKLYRHICQLYPEPANFYFIKNQTPENPFPHLSYFEQTPFRLSAQQLKKIQPDAFLTGQEEIEDTLESNFDNPAYFKLWDLYQIELLGTFHEPLMAQNKKLAGYWKLVYDMSMDDFMKIPFRLNTAVCNILHLYHNWDEKMTTDNLAAFAENQLELGLNSENSFSSWLIWQSFQHIRLTRLDGWYTLFNFMETEPVCGATLLKLITQGKQFMANTESLRSDIYYFLTSQLLLYFRILPQEQVQPVTETNDFTY